MSHSHRYDTRQAKSEKILAVLRQQFGADLSALHCLDVGCAIGVITAGAAPSFRFTVGIDLDLPAIQQAAAHYSSPALQFAMASGHAIPFPDNSFDVIICAQVYEHSTDQPALAAEIYRVLRPDGACFFSGPNRLWILEEHYWLPFLSWLPHPLADRYMRLFKRGPVYDAYPRTYWTIRKLWRRFQINDYTAHIIRNPQQYNLQRGLGRLSFLGRLPLGLLNLMKPFFPNYNWILVKQVPEDGKSNYN